MTTVVCIVEFNDNGTADVYGDDSQTIPLLSGSWNEVLVKLLLLEELAECLAAKWSKDQEEDAPPDCGADAE
jgi:hypothetical protein